MAFLKKFLQYAKRMEPVLTENAGTLIGAMYAELRTDQASKVNGYPITARCLETLIRLSTAHAKGRLSEEVEEEDVREAMRIIKSAIDGSKDEREEEKEREGAGGRRPEGRWRREGRDDNGGGDEKYDGDQPPRPRRRTRQEEDEEKAKRREDVDAEEGGEEKGPSLSARRRRRSSAAMDVESPQSKRRAQLEGEDAELAEGGREGVEGEVRRVMVEEEVPMGSARGQVFVKALARLFYDESVLAVEEALAAINGDIKGRQFTRGEADQLLAQLEQANKVMYRDGQIYRI